MKILHISSHYGGGVFTVLSAWTSKDKENEHSLTCFGYVSDNNKSKFTESNILVYDNCDKEFIYEQVKLADIVLIHYWNYPLMIDFLYSFEFPKCRLIFWSHVSGLNLPYVISDNVIELSDKFIFTSPISYRADDIHLLEDCHRNKLDVIMSTGGVDNYYNVTKKDHSTFNILYVGTLDFAKLKIDFVKICYEILKVKTTKKIKFIICGSGSSEKEIKQQVKNFGIEDYFEFTGLVDNINPYLAVADLFLYPLEPSHFGTGEQSICHAMSVGVIPIVFNNPCEAHIVKNGISGFIVDTVGGCVAVVHAIIENKIDTNTISQNAIKSSMELYSLDDMILKWNKVFDETLQLPKTTKKLTTKFRSRFNKGFELFIESLGNQGRLFNSYIIKKQDFKNSKFLLKKLLNSNPQWKSKSKGSLNQYLEFYPDDEYLLEWNSMIDE